MRRKRMKDERDYWHERQTVEEAKGDLHSTCSYIGAYYTHTTDSLYHNNVQTDWQLLLYCSTSPHYFLDDLPMRHSTDAYCLAAILFFLTLPAPFSNSISRRTIVTSESKVQRRFAALCRWWGPRWEPSAAALWSCLVEWMDSVSHHLLLAIMIIKCGVRHGCTVASQGALPSQTARCDGMCGGVCV